MLCVKIHFVSGEYNSLPNQIIAGNKILYTREEKFMILQISCSILLYPDMTDNIAMSVQVELVTLDKENAKPSDQE